MWQIVWKKSTFFPVHHLRSPHMFTAKARSCRGAQPTLTSVWHHLRQAPGSQGGLQVSKPVLKRQFPWGHWPAGQRLAAGKCHHSQQQGSKTASTFWILNSSATLVFKIPKIPGARGRSFFLFTASNNSTVIGALQTLDITWPTRALRPWALCHKVSVQNKAKSFQLHLSDSTSVH